ncbi:MAG: tetratricopeptide repeat protein [archaeon]|nr:tetratricopeptide repeat protein [archaeon]
MSAPENYLSVEHGNMVINVPRNVFKGADGTIDREKADGFTKLIRARYPWLSKGSVDVLLRNARKEYLKVLDEETGGRSESGRLEKEGDVEGAIRHLRKHLEEDPEDAETWYALGRLLCANGRAEEGYRAFNMGRSLL